MVFMTVVPKPLKVELTSGATFADEEDVPSSATTWLTVRTCLALPSFVGTPAWAKLAANRQRAERIFL